MEKRIEAMRDVMKVQEYNGNWDYDPYMHGMYNGMELMLAMAEGREPVFRDAPKEWRADKPSDERPVVAATAAIEATE